MPHSYGSSLFLPIQTLNMPLLMQAWYVKLSILEGRDFNSRQIFSRAHAMAAVFRAVNDYLNSRLRSRNVHAEIVFSLSPTNNVC